MSFSEGWKSGYKNRDLAIKNVIGCIISIFGAKKVAIKTVMAIKTVAIKTVKVIYLLIDLDVILTFAAANQRREIMNFLQNRYSMNKKHENLLK